jgi:N-acetylmuramoyl-L-alanine amidase
MVPVNEMALHAGNTANTRYIGIELCEPKDSDPDRVRKFTETWNRAVWYYAWLLIHYVGKTTVTPQVIPSHAEISKWWKQTNHTDPVGFFKKYGKTVEMFRSDVQKEINRQLKGGK